MESIVLDFNKDRITDLIMSVESSLQDSLEEEYPRLLIVLQGLDSVNYKIKAVNDSLLLCKNCGGFFDPYDGLSLIQDTLLISQMGGSAWRWEIKDYCTYEKNTDDWYIVKEYTASYHIINWEDTRKEETVFPHKKLDNKIRQSDNPQSGN